MFVYVYSADLMFGCLFVYLLCTGYNHCFLYFSFFSGGSCLAFFYHLESGRKTVSRCLPIDLLDNEEALRDILENTEESEVAAYVAVGILVLESCILFATFIFVCLRQFQAVQRSIPVEFPAATRASKFFGDLDLNLGTTCSIVCLFTIESGPDFVLIFLSFQDPNCGRGFGIIGLVFNVFLYCCKRF